MATDTTIEQRLKVLENAVAEIKLQLAGLPAVNWVDQITGSLKDEPAFQEVLDYGRAIRSADRPPDGAEELA